MGYSLSRWEKIANPSLPILVESKKIIKIITIKIVKETKTIFTNLSKRTFKKVF